MSGISDAPGASGVGLRPNNEREPANSGPEDPNDPKHKVKRRTKSGCLTCRTRRVKCDEGKPTCQNCAKGKRHCEYASSRVVFKQPMGTDGDRFAARSSSYHQGMLGQRGRSGAGSSLPVLAPKPPGWNVEQGGQVAAPAYHFTPMQQAGEQSSRVPLVGRLAHEHPPQHASMQGGQLSNPLLGASSSTTGLLTPLSNYSSHSHGQGDYMQPVSTRDSGFQRSDPNVQDEDNIYEFQEEEHFGDSDDDMPDPEDEPAPVRDLLHRAWHTAGTGKILDAFLENKALFSYMEHPNQSELRDSGLRAVVWYFINVTSPTISMYEREPYELTRSSQSKDGLATGGNDFWCRTIPLMAFHSAGLLQAILALASLQLANLQNAPPTAAMKHYHLAILRVKRNVTSALGRTRFATLATLLLLAFFEVWAADHSKWCRHLFGASILLKEMPLQQMSKKCLPAKRDRDRKEAAAISGSFSHGDTNLNYELLGVISGMPVAAEDYGLGIGQLPEAPHLSVTERDIKNYENHADLFWWFCKMDVYQSFLGGTKLFMGYSKWLQCPPRTPMSKPKQVYGTYDHVVLLLGRLANFVVKDQARKKKERLNQPPRHNDSPPLFPGIMPTQGRVQPTAGFSPTTSPKSDATEEAEGTLESAIKEWDEIRRAFAIVKTCFSPEFQPLSSEYADRRDSPFGTVVQYRSYAVAGVWMNYYMGLIHLHRSHPKMPYAALQAVGMCAKDTAVYANQIGRIACGLLPDTTNMLDANPLGAAALIECSFCLFVAGVQYQDSTQRQWLIQRLHDTARLTGWMTARQIAEGCESAWVKAAQFGRGQPYTSRFNVQSGAISIWQSPRRLDRMMQQSETSDPSERRIVLARHQRAHYALGLLSVEEDLGVLTLEDE